MTLHCRECKDIVTLDVSYKHDVPRIDLDTRVVRVGGTVIHRPGVCGGVMAVIGGR